MRLFMRLENEKKSCVKFVKLIMLGYLLIESFIFMLFFKTSLLLLYFMANAVSALEDESNWKLAKQANDITVYTRTLAYSAYAEYRGEMSINANIDSLLAFINNDNNCSSWRYKCIKMLNLTDNYIYKLISLPWPFSDRYTVMKSTTRFNQQANSYTIHLKNIPRAQLAQTIQAQLPEQKDTVQMRFSDGYWQFKLAPTGNIIHIIYQMHGDADAALPSELTRLGIVNAAFITLSNLKKHFTQTSCC